MKSDCGLANAKLYAGPHLLLGAAELGDVVIAKPDADGAVTRYVCAIGTVESWAPVSIYAAGGLGSSRFRLGDSRRKG